jgi:4-hydroxy-L-threonine phosphate dehydrogenase PdxA
MADFGLFLGFGQPARGREVQAAKVFGETLAYYAELQKQGEIESFQVAILEPHGGELGGFVLLRGESDRLGKVRASAEFQRLLLRGGFIADDIGVVSALLDGEAARFVSQTAALTADLA